MMVSLLVNTITFPKYNLGSRLLDSRRRLWVSTHFWTQNILIVQNFLFTKCCNSLPSIRLRRGSPIFGPEKVFEGVQNHVLNLFRRWNLVKTPNLDQNFICEVNPTRDVYKLNSFKHFSGPKIGSLRTTVGCVFGRNGHRENAPHFSIDSKALHSNEPSPSYFQKISKLYFFRFWSRARSFIRGGIERRGKWLKYSSSSRRETGSWFLIGRTKILK